MIINAWKGNTANNYLFLLIIYLYAYITKRIQLKY
jgi:hypothetical protein